MLFRGFLSERKKMVDRVGAGAAKKAFFRLAEITHEITHFRIVVQMIWFEGSFDLSPFDHRNGMFASTWRRDEIHANICGWGAQTLLSDIRLRHVPLDIFRFHPK